MKCTSINVRKEDSKIYLNVIYTVRTWARCTYINLHVAHILGIYLGNLLFDFMLNWVKLLLKFYCNMNITLN